MNKEKQIQIPELLYMQMAAYVLNDDPKEPDKRKLQQTIQKGVFAKLDRQLEHDLYTKYKTAPTEQQKEAARKEYLDRKGIHPDFRW